MIRSTRAIAALAALAAIAMTSGGDAHAASAKPDPTFGGDGVVEVSVPGGSRYTYDLAQQPDGGLIGLGYVGGASGDVVVWRLDANGRQDKTFGFRFLDAGGDEAPAAVALQPDGRIVVVGRTTVNGDVAVWRLLPSGAPDTSFSGDGYTNIDSAGVESANDVAVAPDGKIVVVGATSLGPNGTIAVYRLTAAGVMDPSFDGDGAYGIGGDYADYGLAVVVQKDGRIVFTGNDTTASELTVRRLTVSGAMDPTFNDGRVTVPGALPSGRDLALQPDGGILVAAQADGGGDEDALIVRLTPRGTVDPDFATPRLDLGAGESVEHLALLSNGEIVAAGYTSAGQHGFLWVLHPDGSPDLGFGAQGVHAIDSSSEWLGGLVARRDGRIVTSAFAAPGTEASRVLRFQGAYVDRRCHGKVATLVGTKGKDRLVGTKKSDVIVALGGADVVKGLGGNDVVCAGGGKDKVYGGAGRDRLFGEGGRDRLVGGAGKDEVVQ